MEIQVLGPVELRDNGTQVPVGGPRQRRLLAALVVNAGKVVSVDRLIDAVWAGEEPPEQAANALLPRPGSPESGVCGPFR